MRNSFFSSLIFPLSSLHCALPVVLYALVCLLTACSSGPRAELRAADAIMETDPDSAMALLRAIDRNTLADSELPLYALLFTQAQVKQNVHLTSDSLISLALDAYRFDAPAPSLRLRANFYAAQVAYYRGDMPSAMRTAIVAYELSRRRDDPYWTAKSAELIADIFDEAYNYEQNLKYRRIAIDAYQQAGKILNHRFSLCDLAIYHINMGEYPQAISLLDSLQTAIGQPNEENAGLNRYIARAMIPALIDAERFTEADSLIKTYSGILSHEDSLAFCISATYIASDRKDVSKVDAALSSAYGLSDNNKELIRALYAEYRSAMTMKQYEKAAMTADTLMYLQSDVVETLLNQSTTSIQRDFYSTQMMMQQQHSRLLRAVLISAVIIAAIIIILLILLYRQRLKAKSAQISEVASELARYRQTSTDNEKNIELLFKNRTEIFNRLCSEYYTFKDSPEVHKQIKKQLDKEISRLRSPKRIKELEQEIDKYRGGIMAKLRAECPFLTSAELRFLLFSLAGFSAKTIAFLTNLTDNAFNMRKSRICSQIAQSSVSDKELLLEKLNSHSI